MISLLEYLPVPTMSRDVKSLPPSTRFVSCISRPPINFTARLAARRRSPRTPTDHFTARRAARRRSPRTAAHRPDDFHLVTGAQHRRPVLLPGCDVAIDGDRRVLALDPELREEAVDAESVGDVHVLAVHHDPHKRQAAAPVLGAAADSSPHRVPFAGIIRIRFEGSRAAPGSQESSPQGGLWEYPPCGATPRVWCASRGSAARIAGTRASWWSVPCSSNILSAVSRRPRASSIAPEAPRSTARATSAIDDARGLLETALKM